MKYFERRTGGVSEGAKNIMKVLVECAKRGTTIRYKELKDNITGLHLAGIGNFLDIDISTVYLLNNQNSNKFRHASLITTLAVKQENNIPSDFDKEEFNRFFGYEIGKRPITEDEFEQIRSFLQVQSYWDEFSILLGINDLSKPYISSKVPAFRGKGGEGPEHRKLKEYLSKTPKALNIIEEVIADMEAALPSGDSMDIIFESITSSYIVEVKPASSPESDIIRGLFQCLKYYAVKKEFEAMQGIDKPIKMILALGGKFPRSENTTRIRDWISARIPLEIQENKKAI